MSEMNREGMTWEEWYGAATMTGNRPKTWWEMSSWHKDWRNGVDPTEYAA